MTNKHHQIEQGLLIRLKWTVYILVALSVICVGFAMWLSLHTPEVNPANKYAPEMILLEQSVPPNFFLDSLPEELELEATEIINFYLAGLIFAVIALFCHLFIRRSKQKL